MSTLFSDDWKWKQISKCPKYGNIQSWFEASFVGEYTWIAAETLGVYLNRDRLLNNAQNTLYLLWMISLTHVQMFTYGISRLPTFGNLWDTIEVRGVALALTFNTQSSVAIRGTLPYRNGTMLNWNGVGLSLGMRWIQTRLGMFVYRLVLQYIG